MGRRRTMSHEPRSTARGLRDLDLGWEYPPSVAGGLGAACHGLTTALARSEGVAGVTLAVPRVRGAGTAVDGPGIERVESAPGRLVQSLSMASIAAWIKFYRPDENSVNSAVSYYVKGMRVAFLLDARIREATDAIHRLGRQRAGGVKVGVEFKGQSKVNCRKVRVRLISQRSCCCIDGQCGALFATNTDGLWLLAILELRRQRR